MRFRLTTAVTSVLAIAALAPASASAGETGGVSPPQATRTAPASATAPAGAPPAHVHKAPVTSRRPSLAYHGPVYVQTATGQLVPYQPGPPAAAVSAATGGIAVGVAAVTLPQLLVPGSTARYVDGLAAAPMSAPAAVQQIIWAANEIIGRPYSYGGGHASFTSAGYDCSGTVSFALHGAGLLATPEDSSELMGFGTQSTGRWVAIFSNPEHAYMTVAGLRLDTSAADDPSNQQGPRWRPLRPSNAGYTARHPRGL